MIVWCESMSGTRAHIAECSRDPSEYEAWEWVAAECGVIVYPIRPSDGPRCRRCEAIIAEIDAERGRK